MGDLCWLWAGSEGSHSHTLAGAGMAVSVLGVS
ncbi:hypothetical protein SAMN06272771_3767 [Streptomyces sp. Ag82_O1-12]|nr:hypothetical protein SAMN06272771_3767 [Streptomyces sp. Ag82_O1-12]SOD46400.1 hypothetical protein SAMN06272727_3765 [Streptomyces sp. Ag82_G6-1]